MEKRIPRRRFKEFIGSVEWEEKKIEQLGDIITGSTPPTMDKDNYGNEFMFISPIDIQKNRYIFSTKNSLSKKGFEKGRIIRKDSIVFVSIGSTIGKVAQVGDFAVTNQQINTIEPYDNNNDEFIYSLMMYKSKDIKLLASNQAVPIINKNVFSNIEVFIPSLAEQEKIGDFFQKLDKLIDINREKLDKLKASKSAYLEEMFPKEGEVYPRRRFEGFIESWEEKKLGEVSIAIGDGLHGTPKYSDDGTLYFINGNNLVGGEIVVTKSTKKVKKELDSNKKIYEKSTILMSINGTIGNLAFYNGENIMLGKSVGYITVNTINIIFLFFTLQTRIINKYFNSNLTGSTIKNLGLGIIRNTRIKYPSLAEQEKIGNFFKKLDQQIEVQEEKLEKLEKMKKAYLAEMFI